MDVLPQSFGDFVYFTDQEHLPSTGNPSWFCSPDWIDGPLHTNAQVHIWGDPRFGGMVTSAWGGPDDENQNHDPLFMYYNGDFNDHVDIAGSVTVAGILGPLSIENRDRGVLALVSPGESVTIPSVTVSGDQKRMLAQVGEPEPSEAEPIEEPIGEPEPSQPPFGLESWTPVVVGGGLLAAGIAIPLAASGGSGSSSDAALPPVASF